MNNQERLQELEEELEIAKELMEGVLIGDDKALEGMAYFLYGIGESE